MECDCEEHEMYIPMPPMPVMVKVEASSERFAEMQTVLGADLLETLKYILETELELGWTQESPSIYVRALSKDKAVSIRLNATEPTLRITLFTSLEVEEALKTSVQQELDHQLMTLEPTYRLVMNELWDRCYLRAISDQASRMGTVVEQTLVRDKLETRAKLLIHLNVG